MKLSFVILGFIIGWYLYRLFPLEKDLRKEYDDYLRRYPLTPEECFMDDFRNREQEYQAEKFRDKMNFESHMINWNMGIQRYQMFQNEIEEMPPEIKLNYISGWIGHMMDKRYKKRPDWMSEYETYDPFEIYIAWQL